MVRSPASVTDWLLPMVMAKVGSAPVEAVPCVQKVRFDV